jgi:hypothetical protein
MKPFNLEEALNGAKVVTRDGREVTQLTKFNADEDETLFGVVNKEIASWKDDGRFSFIPPYNDHILDLFMHVEPVRIWVNIFKRYNGNDIYVGGNRYKSKEDAINSLDKNDPDYIKTIEINDIV